MFTNAKILESMHATAKGLYDAGVMDAVTMRNIDDLCLPPVEKISAKQIKQLRISNKCPKGQSHLIPALQ
jgi:putative transcriptional regulator